METRTDPNGIGLQKFRACMQAKRAELDRRENEAMRTMYLGPDNEPSVTSLDHKSLAQISSHSAAATMPAASKSFNTIIGIANWFGVTPKTIYSWRKTDSSFAPLIDLAYRVSFNDPHYQKRAREFSSDK